MTEPKSTASASADPHADATWVQRAVNAIRRGFQREFGSPERRRLAAAIDEMNCRVSEHGCGEQCLAGAGPGGGTGRGACVHVRIAVLLEKAIAAAEIDNRFVAYDMLQCIERELVELMTSNERRLAFDAHVREAKEKLGGWRRSFVDHVATMHEVETARDGKGGEPPDIPVVTVRAVMRHVHQHSQNHQHKLELLTRRMTATTTVAIGCAVLVLLAILVPHVDPLAVFTSPSTTGDVVRAGALLGLFGGLFSMLTQHAGEARDRKIPEVRHALLAAAGRPAIGAALAIPIVLLFTAGLFGDREAPLALILGACFVGGFSERWFVSQVEGLVGAGGRTEGEGRKS